MIAKSMPTTCPFDAEERRIRQPQGRPQRILCGAPWPDRRDSRLRPAVDLAASTAVPTGPWITFTVPFTIRATRRRV